MKIPCFFLLFLLVLTSIGLAQEHRELAIGQPDAVVDLRTDEGIQLLHSAWKYSDAQIVETDFQAPGPGKSDPLALYPTGNKIKSHTLIPKAGPADFDDSQWETLSPTSLEVRRGQGLLSFNWYRLQITIPDKIGHLDPTGSTVVFEVVLDDYSEIWVNGVLDKTFGQAGHGVISGFNTRNRVFLTDNAKPGDQFQIAILGINGPLADLPSNYIWIRSATLDFYKEYPSIPAWKDMGQIITFDQKLVEVFNPEEKVEQLAEGFQFIEGPVWHPDGYLLFSDPNANVIYKYDPLSHNVSIYLTKSGYSGQDIGKYHQPGSNGLALDQDGRLVVCQHGNRRIIRHEKKGPVTVLAAHYQGKRLNSPNDLVFKSDGSLYFTDPPYGLPMNYKDEQKELPFQGVYRIANEKIELLTTDLGGPNGIAFSPDERYLYVGNWDIRNVYHTKTVWRFEVGKDGKLNNGKIFFNFDQTVEAEAIDGIKVDSKGYLFVSAPGGVWILSPEGTLLGRITTPERPANMAWGEDGKTLFFTAHSSLYKMRVKNGGAIATKPTIQ